MSATQPERGRNDCDSEPALDEGEKALRARALDEDPGGDVRDLFYVSPKTGRAVSKGAGEVYKERLLKLPEFLKTSGEDAGDKDVLTGLKLTGYFLEHWVYTHHTKGVPDARLRFQNRFEKLLS